MNTVGQAATAELVNGAAASAPGWIPRVLGLSAVAVALLSNASTRLLEDLQLAGLDGHFDAIVSSADIGAMKPGPAAYRAAAQRLGVAPEVCLMVDDRAENVEGARAVGMQGLLYTGPDDLRAALVATGLLPG